VVNRIRRRITNTTRHQSSKARLAGLLARFTESMGNTTWKLKVSMLISLLTSSTLINRDMKSSFKATRD
jgi:hypothetical protein